MKPGLIQGRYRIVRRLGRGSTGVVYLVEDTWSDDRPITLKKFSQLSPGKRLRDGFAQEFRFLKELRHPNLVAVHDFGVMGKAETPFFTAEYVEGKDLFFSTESAPLDDLYPLIVEVCRALEYIHSKGVLHGDLKPENILVREGPGPRVKLVDFGLARMLPWRPSSGISGTLHYCAPEILLGTPTDHRADLYALGMVLYQVVARRLPFEERDVAYLVQKQINVLPERPGFFREGLSSALEELILKLVAKRPEDRFAGANEVIEALNAGLGTRFELETRATEESYVFSGHFVGRIREMKLLREELDRLQEEGTGKVLLISGESGVGKSRLLQEMQILGQLRGLSVYVGSCYAGNTFSAFREIFHYLLRSAQGDPRPEAGVPEQLASWISPPSIPAVPVLRGERENLLVQAAGWLAREASHRPLILHLHDLHQADELSMELLQYIANVLKSSALLVCATYREEESTPRLSRFIQVNKAEGILQELVLEPLDRDNTFRLIRSMFGRCAFPGDFLDLVYRETEGNPFYVEECMKSLVADRTLAKTRGLWRIHVSELSELSLPDTVARAFVRRLNRLSGEAQQVASSLALFHQPAPFAWLRDVTEMEDGALRAALGELQHRQVVLARPDEDRVLYDFKHQQMKSWLYGSLETNDRLRAHLRIGTVLEDLLKREGTLKEHVLEVAHHFRQADHKEKLRGYALGAAEQLRTLYAHEEALGWYRVALPLLGPEEDERRVEVQEKIGYLLSILGEGEEAYRIFSNLLEQPSVRRNLSRQAKLRKKLAKIHERRTEFSEAIRILKDMLELVRTEDNPRMKAELLGSLALQHFRLGEYDTTIHYCLQGLEEIQGLGEKGVWAGEIYNMLGACYQYQGEHQESRRYFQKGLQVYEGFQHLYGIAGMRLNLGNVAYEEGDFVEAIQCAEQALEIQRKIGDRRGMTISCINLSNSYCKQGLHDRALEFLQEALRISDLHLHDRFLQSEIEKDLGQNHYYRGEYARALELFQSSLALAEKSQTPEARFQNLLWLARIYLQLDQLEQAERFLDLAAQAAALPREQIEVNLHRARWWRRRGDLQEARSALEKLITESSRLRIPFLIAEVALELAEVCLEMRDLEAAEIQLRRSLQLSGEKNFAHAQVRTLIARARVAGSHGHASAAEEDCRQAWELSERIRFPEGAWEALALWASLEARQNRPAAQDRWKRAEACLRDCSLSWPEAYREAAVKRRLESFPVPVGPDPQGLEQDRSHFLTLFQVSKILTSILSLDELVERILEVVLETVNGERAALFLVDASGQPELRLMRDWMGALKPHEAPVSTSVVAHVAESLQPLISTDTDSDPRLKDRRSIIDLGIRMVLCLPICLQEKLLGVLYLDRRTARGQFAEKDIDLLNSLCNLFAVALENARLHEMLRQENLSLKEEVESRFKYDRIIGKSLPMLELYRRLDTISRADANVLILGESGTGKELVARAIHFHSPRKNRRFVAVDCGGLPEPLIESELFGHRKGAFTGAGGDKMGLFELADGGTVFLDEIGNMPKALQAKLLRVLQEREVRRLGENLSRKIDVRIIAATHQNLQAMMQRGEFREDLYYRLNVLQVQLPPLRERGQDTVFLAFYFLKQLNEKHNTAKTLSRELQGWLESYTFPGNVRELENLIAAAYYTSSSNQIDARDLPVSTPTHAPSPPSPAEAPDHQAEELFSTLLSQRGNFWNVVKEPFLNRSLSRACVREVVRRGLVQSKGRYKNLVHLFNLKDSEYKALMNFLRKQDCLVDFRPYRS
ncbi:MAG: sigma 54-interacting transcriptional regulator [Acidobacteria bacterium]|nr:sigma 54-interacting transcriptional regulator [Acidobacteriota bacterium]